MPAKPRSGDRILENALGALVKALDETRAPWMIINGIAGIARGIRRFTTDIDAAVRGDAVKVDELVASLARHGIVPRIDDAVAFAEANLVLLLRHDSSGVDLDVSLAWSAFEHDALAACTIAKFGRVSAPMCTPEDLIVFKAIAGRPKDAEDAQSLLLLYPAIDVARVGRRVEELAELAEAPELAQAFKAWVAKSREATLPSKPTARAKKKSRS